MTKGNCIELNEMTVIIEFLELMTLASEEIALWGRQILYLGLESDLGRRICIYRQIFVVWCISFFIFLNDIWNKIFYILLNFNKFAQFTSLKLTWNCKCRGLGLEVQIQKGVSVSNLTWYWKQVVTVQVSPVAIFVGLEIL